jgi:hypothetical protein
MASGAILMSPKIQRFLRYCKKISTKNIPPGSGIWKKFLPDPKPQGKKSPDPGSGTLLRPHKN